MQFDITYIGHSGFSIELNHHFLLFDYFHGALPANKVNASKYPVAFSSHSHSDHFNKKIFTLANSNPSVRYFLSDDIKAHHDNAIYMKPYAVHKVPDIEVYTFGSTDIGVSFAILCEGISIFHAGDLNLWSWKGESTKEEIDEAYKMFEYELSKVSEQFDGFDIAFFPVDPRLKVDYDEGAMMFLEKYSVTHFFPMHFGIRYHAAKSFQKKYMGDTIIYAPSKQGEIFKITI